LGDDVGRAQAKGSRATGVWDKSLIFDRAHLARYTMDNTDLEREIMGLFVVQLPSILASLFAARCTDDWRLATHTLKGSAQAIGACRIGEIARELELLAVFEKSEKRRKLLASLLQATREFDDLARSLYPLHATQREAL